MPKLPSSQKLAPLRLIEIASFVVLVALFEFVSSRAGMRWLGVMTIGGAVMQAIERRIPYGWEGREPSGHITGTAAVILSALTGCVGMVMLFQPDWVMAIFGWDIH